jgi:hypothetical protein
MGLAVVAVYNTNSGLRCWVFSFPRGVRGNQEPTALFFLFVTWPIDVYVIFSLHTIFHFSGDNLIFTLSQELV